MRRSVIMLFCACIVCLASGCAINHQIADDYPQYLADNGKAGDIPNTKLESDYFIDSATQKYSYVYRSWGAGYGNKWIVQFGKMLDETLNAAYVQSAFGRLQRQKSGADETGYLIAFDLKSYTFDAYRANVSMQIVLTNAGKTVLDKTYTSEGGTEAAHIWTTGAFGTNNAMKQSTKMAIDNILTQFIKDINKIDAGSGLHD